MMFISRFNRMVRNRILWGIFAFIVVISFVGYFTPSTRRAQREAESVRAAGKVDGQPVSQEEFRIARFHTYLSVCMMVGRVLNLTSELDKEVRKEAWQRLLALRKARELGIRIRDGEVVAAIRSDETFQENGVFSEARYNAFLRGFLANLRATPRQFEEYLREQVALQKMQSILGMAVWMPPTEIQETLHMYADGFSVEYVTVRAADVTNGVKVSSEEARTFFESHSNFFIIPEKVRVKYVSYPLTNFLAGVNISDRDVTNYYDEHLAEFTFTDTNDMPVTRQFAEVKAEIWSNLVEEAATEQAREKATVFVDSLTPDRNGKAAKFEEAAANSALMVRTSLFFSEREFLTNLNVGLDFNRAAFALRSTPEDYFSEPVVGHDAVCVLALDSREAARLPKFAEIQEKAMAMARDRAVEKALRKKAEDIRKALEKARAGGQKFEDAAKALGLAPIKPKPFTAYTAPEALDQADVLPRIVSKEQGEISDIIETAGEMLIAYIAERRLAPQETVDSLKPKVVGRMNRYRGRIAFQEWQESLLKAAKLEETSVETAPEPEPPDEGDDNTPPVEAGQF